MVLSALLSHFMSASIFYLQLTKHTTTNNTRRPNDSSSSAMLRVKNRLWTLFACKSAANLVLKCMYRDSSCLLYPARSLDVFKKEWIAKLEALGVPEPYWSVKWIVEHVKNTLPTENSEKVSYIIHMHICIYSISGTCVCACMVQIIYIKLNAPSNS